MASKSELGHHNSSLVSSQMGNNKALGRLSVGLHSSPPKDMDEWGVLVKLQDINENRLMQTELANKRKLQQEYFKQLSQQRIEKQTKLRNDQHNSLMSDYQQLQSDMD